MTVLRCVGIGMIILAICLGLAVHRLEQAKIREFNNGICPKCGTPYRFLQAVGHHGSYPGYIYICDHCDKMIEMNRYMGGLHDDEEEQ